MGFLLPKYQKSGTMPEGRPGNIHRYVSHPDDRHIFTQAKGGRVGQVGNAEMHVRKIFRAPEIVVFGRI